MIPRVDIAIALHDLSRPIERAVASVVTEPRARAIVVCHGIDTEPIEKRLEPYSADHADQVRVVAFCDGIRSPAGPFNHGLNLATAPLVAVMGSDDFLEPGALAAWIAAAEDGAAVVIGRLRHQSGEIVHAPLARPFRSRRLDPVRDRLAYRTAPLGLIRREVVESRGLRFTEGMSTGEDLDFGLRLWTSGLRIDFARRAPGYVIGADVSGRVTTTPRPVADELAAVKFVIEASWVKELPVRLRRAVAIKLLRIHILGAIRARTTSERWNGDDRHAMQEIIEICLALAPGILGPFPRADHRLIAQVLAAVDDDGAVAAVTARTGASRADEILTVSPLHLLDREGVIRRYANYALSR